MSPAPERVKDAGTPRDAQGCARARGLRREPRRWNTRFASWITRVGVTRLCVDLSRRGQPVTPNAIYQWVAGVTTPRPSRAAAIVELSAGELGMADVYAQRRAEAERT